MAGSRPRLAIAGERSARAAWSRGLAAGFDASLDAATGACVEGCGATALRTLARHVLSSSVTEVAAPNARAPQFPAAQVDSMQAGKTTRSAYADGSVIEPIAGSGSGRRAVTPRAAGPATAPMSSSARGSRRSRTIRARRCRRCSASCRNALTRRPPATLWRPRLRRLPLRAASGQPRPRPVKSPIRRRSRFVGRPRSGAGVRPTSRRSRTCSWRLRRLSSSSL